MNTEPENEPKLGAPGAGIPPVERWIARALIAWGMRGYRREKVDAFLADERDGIIRLVSVAGDERAGRRVLVPRLRGLEDSSRYWSAYMVLEHLRIVNALVASTIEELGAGRCPEKVVGTADVKPGVGVGAEVVEGFGESCAAVTAAMARFENPRTATRYPHPWFGPFDAAGWHHLAAFHARLHRRQVEAILSRLPHRGTPPVGSRG